MRTFFGHLVCECESVSLVCYPITTPDATMEISGHHIVCLDCVAVFHDAVDEPIEELRDEPTEEPTIPAPHGAAHGS